MYRSALAVVLPALTLTLSGLVGSAAAEGQPVSVSIDHAKVFKIEQPAATVIVGNPMIADVTMHDRYTVVVTGRSAGATNLIILDKASQPIIDEMVVVSPPSEGLVTVTRKMSRYSYACTPVCDSSPRVGDEKDAFESASGQINARDGMARQAAGGGGGAATPTAQ